MGDLRSSERKEGQSLPRGRENKERSKELLAHRGTETMKQNSRIALIINDYHGSTELTEKKDRAAGLQKHRAVRREKEI